MTQSASKSRWSHLRWHAFYAAAVLGLFGAVSLGWFGVGQRVGDGTGFYVMFFAWAENGTPYSTDRAGEKFVEYVKPRPEWTGQQHYSRGWPIREDGTADDGHFWLYSMLAAIFYWPLKLLGTDVGLSFNCLHVALLYVAVVLVHRRLGPAAACSLVVLAVASPVLWYANKAHTEWFTVVLGSLGAAYLVAGRHAAASLSFAIIATQNPAFGLVSLLALAMGLVSRGWRNLLADWKLLAAVAAVLALHPAYYWLRARAVSPMLVGRELLFHTYFFPLRHIASFWIDPDIGLLATWPLGLPLLIAGIVMFARRRSRQRVEYAVFFVLSSLLLTWSYARLSTGFGGGGTVDVSRYSVWLVFLFFPILWHFVERNLFRSEGRDIVPSPNGLKSVLRSPNGLKSVLRKFRLVAFVAGLSLAGFSAWLYRPWLDEGSRRPTPQSNWFYAHLSACYDPLPRIFYYSRGGRRELYGEDQFRWGDWAVSDASGNKVFVWREAFDRHPQAHPLRWYPAPPEAPAAVLGRGCLDPQAVYSIAAERFARLPAAEFCYINDRGQELFAPPTLGVGNEIALLKQGHGERFLASGWFPPEDNGTWSNGPRAELAFRPLGVEAERSYAIRIQISQVAGAGRQPLVIEPALNGSPLGPRELLEPGVLRLIVPGEKLLGPATLALAIRNPISPRQAGLGSDPRQLGVKVASLRLQAVEPPSAARRLPEEAGRTTRFDAQ